MRIVFISQESGYKNMIENCLPGIIWILFWGIITFYYEKQNKWIKEKYCKCTNSSIAKIFSAV